MRASENVIERVTRVVSETGIEPVRIVSRKDSLLVEVPDGSYMLHRWWLTQPDAELTRIVRQHFRRKHWITVPDGRSLRHKR